MFLESVAKQLFLVPISEEVAAEQWAIVEETPLKVALKTGVTARVTSGELDPDHASPGLNARLLPEQRDQTSDLDK